MRPGVSLWRLIVGQELSALPERTSGLERSIKPRERRRWALSGTADFGREQNDRFGEETMESCR
jgi:hypothetical protein